MIRWLREKFEKPARPLGNAEEAVAELRLVTSDAQFEDVWEHLDTCPPDPVRELLDGALDAGELGEYPAYGATLWLGSWAGNAGQPMPGSARRGYEDALDWALGLHENAVVLGAALGGLDALEPGERNEVAVAAFDRAGVEKPRRYWLLLKVRTDSLMERIVAALEGFREPDPTDPSDDDFVYSPTAANWMAGAFRQFQPDDYELAARYFSLESSGARFLVEALGSTMDVRAVPNLEAAAKDERPAVRAAAERHLRTLTGR